MREKIEEPMQYEKATIKRYSTIPFEIIGVNLTKASKVLINGEILEGLTKGYITFERDRRGFGHPGFRLSLILESDCAALADTLFFSDKVLLEIYLDRESANCDYELSSMLLECKFGSNYGELKFCPAGPFANVFDQKDND